MNEGKGRGCETPRERLFKALAGEPTERVPVWLLFPYHPTSYYVNVLAHAEYRRVFEFGCAQGVITLDRRNLRAPLHTPEVATLVHDEDGLRRRILQWGNLRVVSESKPRGGGKKLLTTDEDLETFCALPVDDDPKRIAAAMEAQWPSYLRERAEFPAELGAMMLDLGSPVNVLYHESELDAFAIWSVTHAATIERWLEHAMVRIEIIYRWCLERDLADVYFLVGSELAAPPLVSRETFRRWVLPYESRLIRLIHSYGKKVIQHFHGHIRGLLLDFGEMAPDGLHTIEAPPTGDCPLSEAYVATNERITLIGNVQYDEFRSLAPEMMRLRVQRLLEEVGRRRFILSPTAGPFDPSPPPRLIENYLAFIAAAVEFRRDNS